MRPSISIVSKHRLGQFVGISGASAPAHRHLRSESTIYLGQGTVSSRYGERFEHAVVNQAGVQRQDQRPTAHGRDSNSVTQTPTLRMEPLGPTKAPATGGTASGSRATATAMW